MTDVKGAEGVRFVISNGDISIKGNDKDGADKDHQQDIKDAKKAIKKLIKGHEDANIKVEYGTGGNWDISGLETKVNKKIKKAENAETTDESKGADGSKGAEGAKGAEGTKGADDATGTEETKPKTEEEKLLEKRAELKETYDNITALFNEGDLATQFADYNTKVTNYDTAKRTLLAAEKAYEEAVGEQKDKADEIEGKLETFLKEQKDEVQDTIKKAISNYTPEKGDFKAYMTKKMGKLPVNVYNEFMSTVGNDMAAMDTKILAAYGDLISARDGVETATTELNASRKTLQKTINSTKESFRSDFEKLTKFNKKAAKNDSVNGFDLDSIKNSPLYKYLTDDNAKVPKANSDDIQDAIKYAASVKVQNTEELLANTPALVQQYNNDVAELESKNQDWKAVSAEVGADPVAGEFRKTMNTQLAENGAAGMKREARNILLKLAVNFTGKDESGKKIKFADYVKSNTEDYATLKEAFGSKANCDKAIDELAKTVNKAVKDGKWDDSKELLGKLLDARQDYQGAEADVNKSRKSLNANNEAIGQNLEYVGQYNADAAEGDQVNVSEDAKGLKKYNNTKDNTNMTGWQTKKANDLATATAQAKNNLAEVRAKFTTGSVQSAFRDTMNTNVKGYCTEGAVELRNVTLKAMAEFTGKDADGKDIKFSEYLKGILEKTEGIKFSEGGLDKYVASLDTVAADVIKYPEAQNIIKELSDARTEYQTAKAAEEAYLAKIKE